MSDVGPAELKIDLIEGKSTVSVCPRCETVWVNVHSDGVFHSCLPDGRPVFAPALVAKVHDMKDVQNG